MEMRRDVILTGSPARLSVVCDVIDVGWDEEAVAFPKGESVHMRCESAGHLSFLEKLQVPINGRVILQTNADCEKRS